MDVIFRRLFFLFCLCSLRKVVCAHSCESLTQSLLGNIQESQTHTRTSAPANVCKQTGVGEKNRGSQVEDGSPIGGRVREVKHAKHSNLGGESIPGCHGVTVAFRPILTLSFVGHFGI